jgi:hypothetical protein
MNTEPFPRYSETTLNNDNVRDNVNTNDIKGISYEVYIITFSIIFIIILMILYFTGVISPSQSTFVVDTTSTKLGNDMPNVPDMPKSDNKPRNWNHSRT